MKASKNYYAAIFVLGLICAWETTGCYDVIKSADNMDAVTDADTNFDADSDADTDSDTDGVTDRDIDDNTDKNMDADTDSSSDSDTIQLKPIEVHIVNHSYRIVYLGGYMVTVIPINTVPGGTVNAAPPFCSKSCDEADTSFEDWCCMECPSRFQTIAILPDERVTYLWDGFIYPTDTDLCACGCYHTEAAPFGDYRFYVASHYTIDCGGDTCPVPTQSGLLDDSIVSGSDRTFVAEVTIPFEGDAPVIEIVRDKYCDDGTEPKCALVMPKCDPVFELLAYQNDCYSCVNPVSCKPWGIPGCETDDDCDANEFCDLCSTSSCPTCDDCIASCMRIVITEK